jgi:tubulin-specific chaperone C
MDPKDRFYRAFQAEATNIQEQIEHLGSIARVGGERQDAIESILAGISKLSNEVADAAAYVPTYDQRLYVEVSLTVLIRRVTRILQDPRLSRH